MKRKKHVIAALLTGILTIGCAVSGYAGEMDDLYQIVEGDGISCECPSGWTRIEKEENGGFIVYRKDNGQVPFIGIRPITIEGTMEEAVTEWSNGYQEYYQERLCGEPEAVSFDLKEQNRKTAGIRTQVSSEDGMETITYYNLIEEINGRTYYYFCAYVSSTYRPDCYEDQTTFFEFLHAVETVKTK